jgi:ABC-type bacteriocin/lantibiotic exporter with double-glycine peptidase domain
MSAVLLAVPHVSQRSQGECLAACAAMMLRYLGHSANYDQLLKLLRVRTSIGAPASNIRQLEVLGVTVIYKQGTWAELQEHLMNNRPCMVLVQTGELPYWDEYSDHAVVMIGLDEEFVYLNDPAFSDAPMQVPRDEFGLAWLEKDEVYAVLMASGRTKR